MISLLSSLRSIAAGLCLLSLASASIAAPDDLVPRGSGLSDAVALLSAQHLLPPGSPDNSSLSGVTARLYTRREFADLIRTITEQPADPRAVSALAYARNILAPELDGEPTLPAPVTMPPVITGFAEVEGGGRSGSGSSLHSYGDALGRLRALGTLGRDGAYTVSVTNIYRQTRDHASATTRSGGTGGADNPNALDGIDEAYVTALGSRGLRLTLGELRQRWGSGYRGDMMLSDNAPARPTLQVELPFSLGHPFGIYRFTQLLSRYSNGGQTVYQGDRRLEHPIGDRTELSVEESYSSTNLGHAPLQFLPYFAYQKLYFNGNKEPFQFNYNFNLGVTVTPQGPGTSQRVYGQFYIDDLQAPKGLGKGNITPRKIGYLLGFAQTFDHSGTDVAVEFARTDRETYTKLPPYPTGLAWFDGDLPLGHPIGPNGKELFLRIGQRLSQRLDCSIEARDRRRASEDFPAPKIRSLDVALNYHLGRAQSVGLRFSDYHEDPYPGPALPADASAGGVDYGTTLRRHIVAISFLQGF